MKKRPKIIYYDNTEKKSIFHIMIERNMLQKLKVKGIKWIDGVGLNEQELRDIIKDYNFHELDIEACLENNQRARVDSYEDYIFMVLHFPKYNREKRMYELNEFNIFIGRDFLLTFRNFPGTKTTEIFQNYMNMKIEKSIDFKVTSAFILYEIIQGMLEKAFKNHDAVMKDLKMIENNVFENTTGSLVKELMIKKRNIVVLKHMFIPQIPVMKLLEDNMNKLFPDEIEVYFEDLDDKTTKIVNDVRLLEEYLFSIEDAFKSIIDIQTNNIITFLAIFSAFFLPLTLVTSFYGMNVPLPFAENPYIVYWMLLLTLGGMFIAYFLLKKRGKF